MKKKIISIMMVITLVCVIFTGCGSSNVEEETTVQDKVEVDVSVAALKGPTAMGMVKLMDDADNGYSENNNYTFTISASPDEITPKLIQGELDIAAVPANLASVLYNNTDGAVSVIAINTLGVIYIVENGESIQSVEDLRGKTIYASGKGATPEYALNYMLLANGIDPEEDVTIEYKSEHAECVAALAAGENTIAMLPQPFVTTAQLENENIRIALNMTTEWETIANENQEDVTLITGVVIARTAFIEENPEAVEEFLEQYESSVEYVNSNVSEAATLIEQYDIVNAEVAQKAIPYCNITFIAGDEMQEKLSGYLEVLFDQNPQSIGEVLPSEDFYYKK